MRRWFSVLEVEGKSHILVKLYIILRPAWVKSVLISHPCLEFSSFATFLV